MHLNGKYYFLTKLQLFQIKKFFKLWLIGFFRKLDIRQGYGEVNGGGMGWGTGTAQGHLLCLTNTIF